MNVSIELRKLIAKRRQEHGLTQKELGEKVFDTKHHIYELEANAVNCAKPSTLTMRRIGNVLGLQREVDVEIEAFRKGAKCQ